MLTLNPLRVASVLAGIERMGAEEFESWCAMIHEMVENGAIISNYDGILGELDGLYERSFKWSSPLGEGKVPSYNTLRMALIAKRDKEGRDRSAP